MAIPSTAVRFSQSMDPHEQLDWFVSFAELLEPDEEATDYELVMLPEAVALGLQFMSGSGRDHHLSDDKRGVHFWTEVADGFQSSPAFDGGGIALPMEVTFPTSSIPPRTRNRTFLQHVVQQ